MGKFYYADIDNQRKKANKIIIGILTTVYIMWILLYGLSLLAQDFLITCAVNLTCSIVLLIVSWILYKKVKNPLTFGRVAVLLYSLLLIYMFLTNRTNVIYLYAMPPVVAFLLYNDWKVMKLAVPAFGVASALYVGARVVIYPDESDKYVLALVAVVILYVTLTIVAKYLSIFSEHSAGKIREENKEVEDILQDVLEVVTVVKDGNQNVSEMMMEIQDASTNMKDSFKEIETSTMVTAESIQEQTVMTKDIQESIGTTKEITADIVRVSDDSREAIAQSETTIADMKKQSQIIDENNAKVAETMKQLKDKTVEVKDIANIIFEISSQTNLLALNASIESARAGEAGRGFAVVADQIRQLADQTRQATESISSIIEELNVNANEAVEQVSGTIDASRMQKKLIEDTANSFEYIDEKVTTLTANVDKMNEMVSGLAAANDSIVSNISQISATAEEVTASTELVTTLVEGNVNNIGEAKCFLDDILETTKKIDKYLVKEEAV